MWGGYPEARTRVTGQRPGIIVVNQTFMKAARPGVNTYGFRATKAGGYYLTNEMKADGHYDEAKVFDQALADNGGKGIIVVLARSRKET